MRCMVASTCNVLLLTPSTTVVKSRNWLLRKNHKSCTSFSSRRRVCSYSALGPSAAGVGTVRPFVGSFLLLVTAAVFFALRSPLWFWCTLHSQNTYFFMNNSYSNWNIFYFVLFKPKATKYIDIKIHAKACRFQKCMPFGIQNDEATTKYLIQRRMSSFWRFKSFSALSTLTSRFLLMQCELLQQSSSSSDHFATTITNKISAPKYCEDPIENPH